MKYLKFHPNFQIKFIEDPLIYLSKKKKQRNLTHLKEYIFRKETHDESFPLVKIDLNER